jgi:hypothetical protein
MSGDRASTARHIAAHIPPGGHLARLVATAGQLAAIDRMLPIVLGPGEAAGLRAVRVSPTLLTLAADSPGRAYRLRYARDALLATLRQLPGLAGIEAVVVKTLPAPAPAGATSGGRARAATVAPRQRLARPPAAAPLLAAAGDCADPRLRAVLERLARHARDGRRAEPADGGRGERRGHPE